MRQCCDDTQTSKEHICITCKHVYLDDKTALWGCRQSRKYITIDDEADKKTIVKRSQYSPRAKNETSVDSDNVIDIGVQPSANQE
jgi:predicted  nucleic acid-binding Zn-ribbon protein